MTEHGPAVQAAVNMWMEGVQKVSIKDFVRVGACTTVAQERQGRETGASRGQPGAGSSLAAAAQTKSGR